MSPLEALSLLDQAVALVTVSRAQHVQIQEAVKVLKGLIEIEETPTDKE